MLYKKMLRDVLNNKSQFFTIFLMIVIGVMVYTGIEGYMAGMVNAREEFYTNYNIQDLTVIGSNFSKDDLDKVKSTNNVKNAEVKLVVNGTDIDNSDNSYLISFIESNSISKFYIVDGEEFDFNKSGVWLDNFYALENNIKVGDSIRFKYDGISFEKVVLGLINVPDHIYDVKDESMIMPDRKTYGFVYMSSNEIPSSYIKEYVMKESGISSSKVFDKKFSDFNYLDYIPYNYIMIDVDDSTNVDSVKKSLEDTLSNVYAVLKVSELPSDIMYQGEIDEGSSYVGMFSGLFLFIALLSVITTMSRVIKNDRVQIGTLKSLGFNNYRILFHYISYGLFISLIAGVCGILLGRYFLGSVFLNLEMSFFEVPNGKPVIESGSYLVVFLVMLSVSFISFLTCFKTLRKSPADTLKQELPNVNSKSLNFTSKRLFKLFSFSTNWNIRDILRNKFRTITGVVGIIGCSSLIVCALGMLNSINYFIKLQFEDLYNFDYKLSLDSKLSNDKVDNLISEYYGESSETLNIEIIKDDEIISNNLFVSDVNNLVRFKDVNDKFIKLDNSTGVYVTRKFALNNGYSVGDNIKWKVYGSDKVYESKIVGLNKEPQNQNITITKEYLSSLGLTYKADSVYTNYDLDGVKDISGVSVIQDRSELKTSMESMLSMMKSMIVLIIVFAVILGGVIIYNMGILSFSEKEYQFATLKVLGFSDKKIKHVFIRQNIWITIMSIIIGLPSGYYLTSWLFIMCLDENYDFGVHINNSTYLVAFLGTFIVSYLVSLLISRKVNKIDMVCSLKGNE